MTKIPLACKFDQETIDAARAKAKAESLPLNRWIENLIKRAVGLIESSRVGQKEVKKKAVQYDK